MPETLEGFDFLPRTRLVFGDGCLLKLGDLARELPAKRVLIVTDEGIARVGHLQRAKEVLEAADIETVVFGKVRENPTTNDVARCLEVARESQIDAFIGLGGGSSLDTAKGCNFLLTNGGEMRDYWGVNKATKPMLPLIAIPTTAGTGSECQSFALIADSQTHMKMACGDVKAAPRIALLDPELTFSQPRFVTACTGVDAIAHAMETAVSTRRTAISALYSREALRLTLHNLPIVLEDPANRAARSAMLLGAAYAGIAIEASMLGAAHAAANPLSAMLATVHGQAVGTMLPHVVRFNAATPKTRELYRELAISAGTALPDTSPTDAVESLIAALNRVLSVAKFPMRIRELGVTDAMIFGLAKEAEKQWTATFNPRPIVAADFEVLYRNAR